MEEFLNADTFHHNCSANAVFNIVGVAREFDSWLQVTIVNNVNGFSRLREEGGDLFRGDSLGVNWWFRSNLRYIARENVFGTVEIVAESEVVYFGGRAKIAVLADDEVEDFLGGGHQSQAFEYSEELLRSDVKGLTAVKILESGFQQDAVCLDDIVHSCKCLNHHVLFFC